MLSRFLFIFVEHLYSVAFPPSLISLTLIRYNVLAVGVVLH